MYRGQSALRPGTGATLADRLTIYWHGTSFLGVPGVDHFQILRARHQGPGAWARMLNDPSLHRPGLSCARGHLVDWMLGLRRAAGFDQGIKLQPVDEHAPDAGQEPHGRELACLDQAPDHPPAGPDVVRGLGHAEQPWRSPGPNVLVASPRKCRRYRQSWSCSRANVTGSVTRRRILGPRGTPWSCAPGATRATA